ncbi:hypothetical protein G6F56_007858 [Rhizopus delemar]|uniref:Zn(2)-C6 fungal-type domain-containing protein n=1 Tax=Rhizopus stolonifer TaxID=4846 RepID=A0A367K9W9_RHIST|nr:hypothetical protein G6F56_007858 [Rhizopus delemar]RCH98967.1 hypothetical protein CU098_004990 [Rhizopus stolonifer]
MGKSNQELKYKRLKVGHACYVCRSKKIKCDGLRPCMQCKARGRNCVSTKEEALAQEPLEACKDNAESSSGSESDDDSILFSRRDKSLPDSSQTNAHYESWTSHASVSIAEDEKEENEYPLFGSFVRWTVEPPLPMHYSHSIEMPTVDIQMHLIDLFFQTYYTNMPVIPKAFFYEQLRVKGPLITPLLLNAIYFTVSGQSSLPDVPKPSVFFNRCRKLVDDFLDTPRVSTVIALCLLSNYEPSPTRGRTEGTPHCRAWIYGGMAFRMCLELGLNVDTPETRELLGPEDIEIRRRVFWMCYIHDKLQSREWERTWTLPSSLTNVALPIALPTDDKDEHRIIMAFTHFAKLAIIAEEGLQIRSLYAISGKSNISTIYGQLEQYQSGILCWMQELANNVLKTEEHYFVRNQLIAYSMLIETSLLLPQTAERTSKHKDYVAKIITLADAICHHPFKIVHYEILAHAIGAALRVIKNGRMEVSIANELVGKSLKIFTTIQQRTAIPNFSETVRRINSMYQTAKKAQQEVKKKVQNSQCDQDVLMPYMEENHRDPQMTNELLSCHTNIDRPCIQTDSYQKQPWLQALHDSDTNQIAMPLTPEDPIHISNLSSPDQSEQMWPIPYLPNSAFAPDGLSCQAQPYFTPFSAINPSNYIASSYDQSTLYMNNTYNYLTDQLDNLPNVSSSIQTTTYQPLYYTN